jgi:two-component system sensor histidine kinase/response regulator
VQYSTLFGTQGPITLKCWMLIPATRAHGQMPGMDGFEATSAIRDKEEHNGGHIPIIAMTAHALKGDQERCIAAGMDGYVSKPIRTNELFSAIERLLGTKDSALTGGPANLADPVVSQTE